jgi:hypothetical protein
VTPIADHASAGGDTPEAASETGPTPTQNPTTPAKSA